MLREIPVYLLLLVLFIGGIGVILFSSATFYITQGGEKLGVLTEPIMKVAEFPGLVRNVLTSGVSSPPQILSDNFPGLDGFRVNGELPEGVSSDKGYILLSAYNSDLNQSEVQMIRIRDQKVLYQWVPTISELTDRAEIREMWRLSPTHLRIYHPLLMQDGGLLFHNHTPLFKLDACSRLEWAHDDTDFHHAIELGHNGTIWAGLEILSSSPFEEEIGVDFHDQAIVNLSPSGEVLFSKSVSEILYENGYKTLLAVGFSDSFIKGADLVHMNDVQPALTTTPYWNRGDLLISVRNLSSIFLYRPSTNKILWLKTGPWLNQHDVNFVGESTISVFGNDVLIYGNDTQRIHQVKFVNDHSDVYLVDLKNDSVTTPFSDVMKAQHVLSASEGRATVLEDGDVFIEETNRGRLLRISPDGVRWEYVRRIDSDHLAMTTWSRYLTEEQVASVLPKLKVHRGLAGNRG